MIDRIWKFVGFSFLFAGLLVMVLGAWLFLGVRKVDAQAYVVGNHRYTSANLEWAPSKGLFR